MNKTFPVIAGVEVTTDDEGRFNLNALHKASGAEKKNGPSYWLALDSTRALISEMKSQTTEIPVVSVEGRKGGTFAHELLAVSYAGWISPIFQLTVNQTFIDYRSGKLNSSMSPAEIIIAQGQAMLAIEQQQARQAQQLAALEQRVDLMDGDTGYQTITAYTRKHGLKLPLSQTKAIGQYAAKLAKELDIQVGSVPDERWGAVNSYPIALLDEVFAMFIRQ